MYGASGKRRETEYARFSSFNRQGNDVTFLRPAAGRSFERRRPHPAARPRPPSEARAKKMSLSPPVAARFSCSGSTVAQSADPTSSWRFNSSRPDSRGFYYFITRFDCQSITLEIFYFNVQSYIVGRLLFIKYFIYLSLIWTSRMSLLFNLMLILTDFKLNFYFLKIIMAFSKLISFHCEWSLIELTKFQFKRF